MDSATEEKAIRIIDTVVLPSAGEARGEVISRVSAEFTGTPYLADTLAGGPDTPENLVAMFGGADCFTLLDYVEALTRSHDLKSFVNHLAQVRYAGGNVSYLTRRHFFSDWFAIAPHNARDITPDLSPDYMVADKQLNAGPDRREYIPGYGIRSRKINYIPADAITPQVVNRLYSGDYVGIYSPLEGLDVSHVGIVIRYGGQVWFRHSSSLAVNRKVADTPFAEYMRRKPGIVVLRAE